VITLNIFNLLILLLKFIHHILTAHLLQLLLTNGKIRILGRNTGETARPLHDPHLLGHILNGLPQIINNGFTVFSLFSKIVHFVKGRRRDPWLEAADAATLRVDGLVVGLVRTGDLEVGVDL
jgi:hypothetical protein